MAFVENIQIIHSPHDDTTPLICHIETTRNLKDHTEYNLRVQRGHGTNNSWIVTKRFRDFVSLDDTLRISGVELPLPYKKVFGKMDSDFIAQRQLGLQNFINAVLQNPVLSLCYHVKQFFAPEDYSSNLQDLALQHISMLLRGESNWILAEPLPDIGWRFHKKYFLVKDKEDSKVKYLLSWCMFGADVHIPYKEAYSLLNLLPYFKHPHLDQLFFSSSIETSATSIRLIHESGSLRDQIYKCKDFKSNFIKKYGKKEANCGLSLNEVAKYSYEILETLKYLHSKNLWYGHLHCGNVVIKDNKCILLDIENSFLGVPSYYRNYILQFRKIQTVEAVDVYCFGQTLYEMAFGEPLNAASFDFLPMNCPPQVYSMLESILSSESLKNELPSIEQLLENSLYRYASSASHDKPQVKIPSKLKEVLRNAKISTERRLQEEQKILHKQRQINKSQAFHMSEEEKERRKKMRKKQMISDVDTSVESHENGQ